MIYQICEDYIKKIDFYEIQNVDTQRYLCLFNFLEATDVAQKFGIDENFFYNAANNGVTKFENHEDFDFICLNTINYDDVFSGSNTLCIYLSKNILIFVCKDISIVKKTLYDISYSLTKSISFEKLLHVLFDKITSDDASNLDKIEHEISDIEDRLLSAQSRNFVKEIIALRKRLLALRRYYEQLLNILDNVLENENIIIGNQYIRYFKISQGKVNRLYSSVLNLKDYLTQVREAYQAQTDIALNSIMKLFTVISVIFMPLTLIVGWYGMNLKMPEYTWKYGYLMVIILCISVVGLCIAYFKKNKWF
jgi:magnesium transporter